MVPSLAVAIALLLLLALLLQLYRFARADGDLTLMGAERRGRTPELELINSVVWVTGASSGIGEELAYQLARLGCPLVLSARRENELQRVKQKCLEISSLQEKDILVLPLDLADRSTHEAATKRILQEFGKIDILINNGGRSQRSLFVDTNLEVYRALMELNFLGSLSLTKCVLPHMMERNQGKIVMVSSLVGITGGPLTSGYAASKHALNGFVHSVGAELFAYPGITVSSVCPGPVQSNIVKNVFTEELSKPFVSTVTQDSKMSTARCARLILVSVANNLKEVWIAEHPYLDFFYIWQYMPTWGWWLMNWLSTRRIQKFQSGEDADGSYFMLAKKKRT
ncbi:dehydrogenase/reductase SDR family member 7 [Tachyglossus aculeatus]|uniref:dehydrogenase/reductase SDR family member 7 n=1 Tax=Tachyglossus aculeatus TaxID=9261 RepID=UPI0018F4A885|nr:dehydrogenase/reductase SDR family member 7 [Tachyglossus aculeatus]